MTKDVDEAGAGKDGETRGRAFCWRRGGRGLVGEERGRRRKGTSGPHPGAGLGIAGVLRPEESSMGGDKRGTSTSTREGAHGDTEITR